jgi:hypothetical protein
MAPKGEARLANTVIRIRAVWSLRFIELLLYCSFKRRLSASIGCLLLSICCIIPQQRSLTIRTLMMSIKVDAFIEKTAALAERSGCRAQKEENRDKRLTRRQMEPLKAQSMAPKTESPAPTTL